MTKGKSKGVASRKGTGKAGKQARGKGTGQKKRPAAARRRPPAAPGEPEMAREEPREEPAGRPGEPGKAREGEVGARNEGEKAREKRSVASPGEPSKGREAEKVGVEADSQGPDEQVSGEKPAAKGPGGQVAGEKEAAAGPGEPGGEPSEPRITIPREAMPDFEVAQAQDIARNLEELAREDFAVFAEYVGRDEATERRIEMAPLHHLINDFDDYCQSIGKYCAIQVPYEHGKSALMCVLKPLYRLGRNRNLTIKLVSASEAIVKVRVKQIRDHISGKHRGAYNRVFPEVKPDYKAGYSSYQIYIEREVSAFPTIWAHSVLSTGEGGRCGYLLLDDVVSRSNALDRDLNMEIIRAVEGTWLKRLHPGGHVTLLNTPWSTKDLMSHICKNRLQRWGVLIAGVNKTLDGFDVKIMGD